MWCKLLLETEVDVVSFSSKAYAILGAAESVRERIRNGESLLARGLLENVGGVGLIHCGSEYYQFLFPLFIFHQYEYQL